MSFISIRLLELKQRQQGSHPAHGVTKMRLGRWLVIRRPAPVSFEDAQSATGTICEIRWQQCHLCPFMCAKTGTLKRSQGVTTQGVKHGPSVD